MSKELVISANRHETRVAILEDDQVVEVYHQRENEYSLAGSIRKGRVTRVLPGMQSAFVDIGLDRDAFLYVSDFFEDNEEYDKIVTSVEEKVLKLDRTPRPEAQFAAPAEEPQTPAETTAAPVAAAVPVPDAATAAPSPDQRRDDRSRDDRDRRGRRSRRRRGKGGRGLPESKFYSPGATEEQEPEEEAAPVVVAAPPPAPVHVHAPAPALEQSSDFFVLPGESLAKYSHADADAEEPETGEPEDSGEVEASSSLPAEVEAEFPSAPAELAETSSAMAAEPSAEPLPELAEAVQAAEDDAAETAEEITAEIEAAAEAEPEVEIAEEADAASAGAAEPVQPEESDLPAEGEQVESAGNDDAEAGIVQAIDGEGAETASVPTSLTANLREQGPRYQHRVSRRMRRKGRDGRDRGPEAGGAPKAPEARVQEPPAQAPEQRSAPRPAAEPRTETKAAAPSIADLLKEGQEIIVQIAKEPLGQKGARITSHIALPGRFLVYMPTVDHIGVSRKIPSDEERSRLKRVLQAHRSGIPGGFIVRTAGDGRSEEELRADMMFLYNLWLDMRQKAEKTPAPALIHHDLNVVERVLRDQLTPAYKSVWVDNEEVYESVLRFVQRFQPTLVSRVKMYTRSAPIFDEFSITSELEKALRPKVWLKSGGYIVINQTEALVAIDVNTGKFVGKSNRLEDTIVKTNTDAIKEIVRQIRLRDLGGIIVVDFIDMDERKNRQKVMQALEEAMRSDRAPYKILQFNDFGLVAITRKRVKQSLERTLCAPCTYCEGAGYLKSPQTVVGEILTEAQKIARAVEGKDVMLRAAPEVAKLLKSNQNTYLQELEEILGRTVIVKSDPLLHQERFDLA